MLAIRLRQSGIFSMPLKLTATIAEALKVLIQYMGDFETLHVFNL